MKENIEDHTDRPNITFMVEDEFPDTFRTLVHIERNFCENLRSGNLPGIGKATDLEGSIFDHE